MKINMIHPNIINLERCYNAIEKELELDSNNSQPTIHTLALKSFPTLEPRRFELDHGEKGIVIPVKSYKNAALNMVFFQVVVEGGVRVMSGHVSPDVEGELQLLAGIFASD